MSSSLVAVRVRSPLGLFSLDTNSVIEIIIKTCNNKTNDNINDLLASANLPLYPEHYRLSDFNTSCLSKEDQEKYEELSKLSFLYSGDKPNVLLYGLPDLGREKVASGLGDACCREQKSVFYITYDDFADIMKIHSGKPKPNKAYSSLLKTNCLIIGNFAETTIYDESILESMHRLLETRAKAHQNSYIQHKYNPKKLLLHYALSSLLHTNLSIGLKSWFKMQRKHLE